MINTILFKLYIIPGFILGFALHEYAHAWMSNKLGDPTPGRQGRLTINPMAHIEPLGFLALLLCGFGWGKPVPINPSYYKHRRRDEFLVAIAGVAMNLILAVAFSFPTKWAFSAAVTSNSTLLQTVYYIFYYTVQINLCLMIFNLLPVPPLDGWNIATQLFNLEKYSWYWNVYRYGNYILIALVLLRVTDYILMPCINFFMNILF